jgi:hypothetical protein
MPLRIVRIVTAVLATTLVMSVASADAKTKAHRHHNPDTVKAAEHDCANHDPLKGHYSLKVLQSALKDIKGQALQYTACADVLKQAIQAMSLGKPKHPGSGGPSPDRGTASRTATTPAATKHHPQINKKIHHLRSEGNGNPVKLPSGSTVTPGAVTTRSASFLSSLPTPLLAVLAALLAAVLAVSARAIQNGVRARRNQ